MMYVHPVYHLDHALLGVVALIVLVLFVVCDSDQRLNIQGHAAGVGFSKVRKTEAGFLQPAVFILHPHSFFDECMEALLQNVQGL